MKNRKTQCTYIYLDPRKPGKYTIENFITFLFEPFYVGRGRDTQRALSHTKKSQIDKYDHNRLKANKINKIKSLDYDIESYIVIIYCKSLQDTKQLEKYFISHIGRLDINSGTLCNLTTGGEGEIPGFSTKRKQSIAKKGKTYEEIFGEQEANRRKEILRNKVGEKNHFFGKSHTLESRQKMSKSLMGRLSPMSGKNQSPEAKRKMSEAHKLLCGIKSHRAGFYKLISPTGITHTFAGSFDKHCKALGIKSPNYLKEVADGKRAYYYGWQCIRLTKEQFIDLQKEENCDEN